MILSSTSPLPSTTTTAAVSSFSLSRPSPATTKSPRVSASSLSFASCSSSSSTPSFGFSLRSSARRSTRPCVLSSPLRVNAMAELVQDKEASEVRLATGLEDGEKEKRSHGRVIRDAKSGEELLSIIRIEAEEGRLPANVAAGMEELFHNYNNAVLKSGIPAANEVVLSNMTAALERTFLDAEDPFVFSPYHEALREPFDYYTFGQNYIRPLVDFGNSHVGNVGLFSELEEKLKQGHNIVLISNHQTEADPAVIALLLERTHPLFAENLIYVAGDRVITDPLCKPFSMGRNLICVYSKKHMFDDPELAEMKKKANIRSLKEMGMLFRAGSKTVWIAPSGGRDRPDPSTGEWYPALFDASSVDNIRRLSERSDAPAHFYPLALLCHDIMPPPAQVEKDIGEKRVISFAGVGLSVGPEISFQKIAAASENPEEAKELFSRELYESVLEQYNVLNSAILGKRGAEASTLNVSLSQPWNYSRFF